MLRSFRFLAKVVLGLILALIAMLLPIPLPGVIKLLLAAALLVATIFELGAPFFFWWSS